MELGPLEEKYATAGAGVLPTTVLLGEMFTVAFLFAAVQLENRQQGRPGKSTGLSSVHDGLV
jgi:hypothetical protein